MNSNDENSYPQEQLEGNPKERSKKGKRRSSILKLTKSPLHGLALDDIDANTQNSGETSEKMSRRSSSRRVSFAEICQIKEIPNEMKNNTWTWEEEQFQNDENDPKLFPEVANTSCGNSPYRQPASTLTGLNSLLSSPIQDSPTKERYRQPGQRSSDVNYKVTSLDFTQCVDVSPGANLSNNEMDMTLNNTTRAGILIGEDSTHNQPPNQVSFYQTEMQQMKPLLDSKVESVAYYNQTQQRLTEKRTSLDFTCCYGGVMTDEGDMTAMELTLNQSVAITKEHAPRTVTSNEENRYGASNIADSSSKLDPTSFLRQLGTKPGQWSSDVNYKVTPLDFTQCVDVSSGANLSNNEMDMTLNNTTRAGILIGEDSTPNQPPNQVSFYQTEMQQMKPLLDSKVKSVAYYNQAQQRLTEKRTSLDFTCCYGGVMTDEGDMTAMELTLNQSVAITKEHAPRTVTSNEENRYGASNIADSSSKLDPTSFLRQLGTKKPSSLAVTRYFEEKAEADDLTSDQMELTYANHGNRMNEGENIECAVRSNSSGIVARHVMRGISDDTNEPSLNVNEESYSRYKAQRTSGTPSDRSYMSVASSTDEPRRIQEWNIDITKFSKDYTGPAAIHNNAANPIPAAHDKAGGDLKCNDASNEPSGPIPDSKGLKQGQMERNTKRSLKDEIKIKRRAVADGEMKYPKVSYVVDGDDDDEVHNVLRHSQTLPVLNSSVARVTPQNSTWTDPGTHEVVHVGSVLFAAKGPAIGQKHSLLNRKPAQRATGLDANPGEESFLMDENIPDEMFEARTGGDIDMDTEDKEVHDDNRERKDPVTPNVLDLVRPDMMPVTKRNLSVISEENTNKYKDEKTNVSVNHRPTDTHTMSKPPQSAPCDLFETPEIEKNDDEKVPIDISSNSEESYSLEEFLSLANVTTFNMKHVTRRSEAPLIQPDLCMEMKDVIYRNCIAEAKFPVWDNLTKQLQGIITENEQLLSVKEQELNRSNPTVFSALKRSLAVDPENSDVVEKLDALKRACRHSAYKDWYACRTKVDEEVLGLLKEQNENLLHDLSLINNHEKDLDDDLRLLDQLSVDFDDKIQELEAALQSEEKSWNESKEELEKSKTKLEELELELQSQEKLREQLSSENDAISCQITDEKNKNAQFESDIHKLDNEMTLAASTLQELMNKEKLLKNLLEWELEEHDAISMKFSFLYKTFKLDISFMECEDKSLPARTKHVNLDSRVSDDSSDLSKFCHQLIVAKFSQCDFVQMFPSRDRIPALLLLVSLVMARVRVLLEEVDRISINHIVYLNDKTFTIEFSSLKNFIKFLIHFDLSNLVDDGTLPREVVQKIGENSPEVITKQLNDIPSTVLCLSKVLKAADKFLS